MKSKINSTAGRITMAPVSVLMHYVRKMTFAVAIAMGSMFVLASCEEGDAGKGVELDVSVDILPFKSYTNGVEMEVGVTSFSVGDVIGITSVVNGNVVQDNLPYSFTNNSRYWQPQDEKVVYHSSATYIVYYPYDSSMTGLLNEDDACSSFSQVYNQSSYKQHISNDMLVWSGEAASIYDLPVTLEHAMSLVAVIPEVDKSHTSISDVSVKFRAKSKSYTACGVSNGTWQAFLPAGTYVTTDVSYSYNGNRYSWNTQDNSLYVRSGNTYTINSTGDTTTDPEPGSGTEPGSDTDPDPDPDPEPGSDIDPYPDPDNYYITAYDKAGNELRIALHTVIKNHTERSYGDLWTDFKKTDARPDDPNKVWDMYSDKPGGTPKYVYTFFVDQGSSAGSEGVGGYNREHSFPKSWFAEGKPMYSDLFHLYPTDVYVNNRRNNYPFGEVSSATWTSSNGSKLGSSSRGISGTVFEPIDAYKGDFARSYFYMITCYMNKNLAQSNGSQTFTFSGGTTEMKAWAVEMFIEWHKKDPVSTKEVNRNDAVYQIQGNRNPFIDYPELVDHIWGSSKDKPFNPKVNY